MKKIISLLALVLALFVLASCAKTPNPQDILGDILKGPDDNMSDIIGNLIGGDENPKVPDKDIQDPVWGEDKLAEPYYEYQNYKDTLIQKINEIIYTDPSLGFTFDPSLINIYEVDMTMWPAAMLWEDGEAVQRTYTLIGYKNIDVKRNKDGAVITYKKDNDSKVTFNAAIDEAGAHYKFDSLESNDDHPYQEIVRTSYGYAAQSYTGGIGMINNLYLISVNGEDGIIGIIRDSEKPGPLSANLAFDFPKEAPEWYHYSGGRLTGISRDGESIQSGP